MKHSSTAMHRCHRCNATSYRQVIERDAEGAMRPCGLYRCTGCEIVFSTTREWRDGPSSPSALSSPRAYSLDATPTGPGLLQPLGLNTPG
jgi:hypothetical protein